MGDIEVCEARDGSNGNRDAASKFIHLEAEGKEAGKKQANLKRDGARDPVPGEVKPSEPVEAENPDMERTGEAVVG